MLALVQRAANGQDVVKRSPLLHEVIIDQGDVVVQDEAHLIGVGDVLGASLAKSCDPGARSESRHAFRSILFCDFTLNTFLLSMTKG